LAAFFIAAFSVDSLPKYCIIYIDLILPQAGFIGYAAGLFAYVFIGSYGLSHAAVISAGIFHLDLIGIS